IVREGLVGLRHAVDVVLALVGAALLGLGVEELVREPLRHRALAALPREFHEPTDGERPGAARRDLDGHLVGRAADAAGADLEDGRQRLDRRLERLDGVLAGPLAGAGSRVVAGPLRGGLPPAPDALVDHLLYEA